jgi:hypothetical protein
LIACFLNRRGQATGSNKPLIVSSLLQDADDSGDKVEIIKQIAASLFAGVLLASADPTTQTDSKIEQGAQTH